MPLEAVMILVDNSESSRNGDYQPTRFEAQADAASIIFQSVTSSNQESSVGLMSVAGTGPEVLTTLTADRGKILDGLHRTKKKIRGSSHLWTGLQVAFLGLKHRQNRSQRQRIIAFVCSPPLEQEPRKLQDLALKLKKNNVSVDFVLFGDVEDDETRKTLDDFIAKVRGDKTDGAQLVVIPPSGKLLSDQLLGTPIMLGDSASAASAAGTMGLGGGGGDEYGEFDFDPAMEPELALALRMSMEEEKVRQEKLAREEEEAAKKASLEAVKEEGNGDEDAGAEGAKGGSSKGATGKKEEDKDGEGGGGSGGGGDKMDTS